MTTSLNATEGKPGLGRGQKLHHGNNSQDFFFVFCFFPPKTWWAGRLLVGEEAGKGLSEAADGLGFGLVVGQIPSQRLCEGVGQRLRFAALNRILYYYSLNKYDLHMFNMVILSLTYWHGSPSIRAGCGTLRNVCGICKCNVVIRYDHKVAESVNTKELQVRNYVAFCSGRCLLQLRRLFLSSRPKGGRDGSGLERLTGRGGGWASSLWRTLSWLGWRGRSRSVTSCQKGHAATMSELLIWIINHW